MIIDVATTLLGRIVADQYKTRSYIHMHASLYNTDIRKDAKRQDEERGRKKEDGSVSSFNSSPHLARPSSLPPTLHLHNTTTAMVRRVLLLLLMAGAAFLATATISGCGFVGLCPQTSRGTVFLPSLPLSRLPCGSPLVSPIIHAIPPPFTW